MPWFGAERRGYRPGDKLSVRDLYEEQRASRTLLAGLISQLTTVNTTLGQLENRIDRIEFPADRAALRRLERAVTHYLTAEGDTTPLRAELQEAAADADATLRAPR